MYIHVHVHTCTCTCTSTCRNAFNLCFSQTSKPVSIKPDTSSQDTVPQSQIIQVKSTNTPVIDHEDVHSLSTHRIPPPPLIPIPHALGHCPHPPGVPLSSQVREIYCSCLVDRLG